MRGVTGILLVGGGIFVLITLFNGTLKFPLGNVNLFGSSLGGSTPGYTGVTTPATGAVKPKLSSGKCPSGFVPNPLARNTNAECIVQGGGGTGGIPPGAH